MTPKHWIPPEKDRPEPDQLRIVKLANGRLRATKWRQYQTGTLNGYYADSRGDGIGSAENPIVAVGAPEPRRRASGPSGKNIVPRQMLRCPDELWRQFGDACSQNNTNRTAQLIRFMEEYSAGHR